MLALALANADSSQAALLKLQKLSNQHLGITIPSSIIEKPTLKKL